MPSQALRTLTAYAFMALTLTACARNAVLQKNKHAQFADKTAAPLPRAYAHNDYKHDRPLTDALENDFSAVEADVHLVDGALLVAHTRGGTTPERTLESLYLEPLKKRVRENNGYVYPGSHKNLKLLIDIKSRHGKETYLALHYILQRYDSMLTRYDGDTVREGPVTVVVSGHRPSPDFMHKQPVRYAAYDGRLPDLDHPASSVLMPLISAKWGKNFRWDGKGDMPEDQKKRLHALVQMAHDNGQQIRFWATPDKHAAQREAVWQELVAADADYINTDHLSELNVWLRANDSPPEHFVLKKTTTSAPAQ